MYLMTLVRQCDLVNGSQFLLVWFRYRAGFSTYSNKDFIGRDSLRIFDCNPQIGSGPQTIFW